MCEFCENKKQLLIKEIPEVCYGDDIQFIGFEDLQVIVDRGYLRIGCVGDMQCMDHGENIKIDYCPICGRKLI